MNDEQRVIKDLYKELELICKDEDMLELTTKQLKRIEQINNMLLALEDSIVTDNSACGKTGGLL